MMTCTEPDVKLSGQYPIKYAAAALGINRRTLGRWEEQGIIRAQAHRTGRKFYTGREILRVWRARM